jgi:hypothetical protein
VAEEGRGENEVVQPVKLAANTAANVVGNVANNATNVAGAQQQNTTANAEQNVGAQPTPAQANYPHSSQRRCIQDEVEIARCGNYDRDDGVADPLDTNHPIQATELRQMHDQELL